MSALAPRTALVRVEDVLLTAIDVALRKRSYTVASLEALRSVASMGDSETQSIGPDTLAVVTDVGLYRWSKFSTADDDDDAVIKPNDAGATGRWLLQANPGGTTPLCLRGDDVTTLPSGYLQSAILYEGGLDDELILRTFAQVPAVGIDWTTRGKERKGTNPGQLSLCDYSFILWIVDENLRGEMTASRGSPVAAEASRSPGAYAIAGDLEDLLDGALGEQLGEVGIGHCQTGRLSVVSKIQKGRRVVLQLELSVWATHSRQGSNARPLGALKMQLQDAAVRPPQVAVDRDNVLISGLRITVGSGLSRAPTNGSAKIAGETVTVSGAILHTFDAWSDTYRDLDADGGFTYTAVPIEGPAPSQADGTLRVGFTRTDGAGATRDVLLAPTLRDTGPVISVEP